MPKDIEEGKGIIHPFLQRAYLAARAFNLEEDMHIYFAECIREEIDKEIRGAFVNGINRTRT